MRIRRRRLLRAAAGGIVAGAVSPALLQAMPTFAISAGTIVTIAGKRDAEPFSGDGQPATQAGLGEPAALAIDAAGLVYIAERVLGAKLQSTRAIIRRIDAAKLMSRIAGTGAPAYEYGASGWSRTRPMIQPRAADLVLSFVNGLAVRGATVYASLADADGSGVVVRIDSSSGSVAVIAGGGTDATNDGPAANALLSGPAGLAVAANGDVLLAEQGAHRVRRVTADGRIMTVAGGRSLRTVPASDPVKGNLAFRVVVDDVGDGGLATRAVVRGPRDVIVDSVGNTYVSESIGHRVRMIDGTGRITTVAGTGVPGFSGDGGPAGAARLFGPQGLAIDASGHIFIADSLNHRVRLVSGGTISTLAGTGRFGYSGDGGPATAATFGRPSALALTSGGTRLLVADEGNRVVRAIALA